MPEQKAGISDCGMGKRQLQRLKQQNQDTFSYLQDKHI